MNCPKCNAELIVVERDNIELDWCPKCSGFWFDADEWHLLGVKEAKYDPFCQESVRINEQGRKCPICEKTMEKISIDGILLDRCPNYHGIWFDKGEVARLVNKASSGVSENEKTTVSFLGEVFNLKKDSNV